jgi:hypothetical protein
MFIEDTTAISYEWDGEQNKSSETANVSTSGGRSEENGQPYDATNRSRDIRPPHSAGKQEIQDSNFPFTSLYRVKTPIRYMKPRSGRPRSAASNSRPDSNLRMDSKDSLGSTPSTMVSDDPKRLLDVKLSRRYSLIGGEYRS